ncbi:Zn-dependent HtpX-like protease [Idiomarina xiamenensis 10-D-4]|uniref:Zn-dependent HtpX-like protease n=2 Tax=Idiomarina xiamenensis TaxID=1207041 RepID=K2LAK4_9GAMM|nr:Zn-dependent HtpX-like protease [Idiomarina xiamenensis 10-D-4]
MLAASAARYGLAIVQLDSGQPAAAEETLAPLLDNSPLEPFYIDVESDILINQQRYDEALAMLEHAYIRRPNEEVITINYANAAIKAGQPRLSIKLLRDFLLREPKHLLALQILSDAYRDVGDIAQMYETNAEVIALYGGFRNAIDQLHTAYTRTDNDLTKKRIQARIEQMREMEQRARTL